MPAGALAEAGAWEPESALVEGRGWHDGSSDRRGARGRTIAGCVLLPVRIAVMIIRPSRVPLQRLMRLLPARLRRIRIVQLAARITGAPYQRIAFQRGRLIGNIRDGAVAHALLRGVFADYGYFELADRLLAPGDTHVDVGANYGFHTFGLLESLVGAAIRYLLIDANPDCVACLRASAGLHPAFRMEIVQLAAAAESGTLAFRFAPAATGEGHVGGTSADGEIGIAVPAAPLDQVLDERGVDAIGLLKMDIEGSEPGALRGLARRLSAHRVKFIYFEVNPDALARQGADPAALFREVTRHGYRLFWPHDDTAWIARTYGLGDDEANTRWPRFVLRGSRPHPVIAFDPARYRQGRFGQCDLLAVSPDCRVENVSSAI